MEIPIKCRMCGQIVVIEATTEQLLARLEGAKVQDAFPDMPAKDREMFVSQTCGKCYREMFRLVDEKEGEDQEEKDDDACECDFEAWAKDNGFETITVEIGNRVICDFCNKEFTKDDGIKGGMLMNRHAACPDCAPGLWDGAKRYNEEMYCTDANPDETFYDFVIRIR